MRLSALTCLALFTSGCIHSVAGPDDAPPPGQAVRMAAHFAWPLLMDTQVQVHQRTTMNGRSAEAAQGWFRLTHEVQPGHGTVKLVLLSEPDAALEVKPFAIDITRDGRLLSLPPPEGKSAKNRSYAHSPQLLWNLWVALWNPMDLVSGQTVELPNDVADEALGHLHFTAYLTAEGYEPCQGAPRGWCQKVTAKFRPDAESVVRLFDAVIDERERRPGEAFEPRVVEYELTQLSEPETLLPHRVDLAFRVEVMVGPARSTSLVRYEQKTSMRFMHMQRAAPPPPSGPQRQPVQQGPRATEQVSRDVGTPPRG